MAQLFNLIGSLASGGMPSLDKFSDLFKKISGGVDALATMIINTQNTVKSYTNQGVYVSDIFGLVPIKTTGYSPGQVYVEYGGTLQAQDRTYFGPVNIHRMAISLLNDRGEVVDLNGANWSLQFVCEQIYQNNNEVKK